MFPWLSADQIKRLLKKLEQGGLLLKGNYNENRFDKTVWYSLNEPEFRVNRSQLIDIPDNAKSHHRRGSIAQSEGRNRTVLTDNKQTDISELVNSNSREEISDSPKTAKPRKVPSEPLTAEAMATLVMTHLLADNLPVSRKRYAELKIAEYQRRFPDSDSDADAYAYTVKAINHQYSITGT